MTTRDEPLTGGTRQTVLAKPTGRFATTIQPENDLAMHVDHLAVRVDAQAR